VVALVGIERPELDRADSDRADVGRSDSDRPDRDGGPERAELAGPRGSPGADAPDIPNGPSRLPSDRTADHEGMPDRTAFHAEYRATVDAVYRADAISRGCDRVREIEETTVTPAMRRVEAEDPDRCLVGLEFRLKGRDRLEEKVAHDMQKRGVTAEQAFAAVKDAIRYTFQYSDDNYSRGVRADVERMTSEGFELMDFRNSWANEEYKGINSRWRVADNGQVFEVQFHTEASFAAKQETHAAYERLRTLPADHDDVRELRAYQREVSAKIPTPPDAQELTIR
jgi:hypothetical protein